MSKIKGYATSLGLMLQTGKVDNEKLTHFIESLPEEFREEIIDAVNEDTENVFANGGGKGRNYYNYTKAPAKFEYTLNRMSGMLTIQVGNDSPQKNSLPNAMLALFPITKETLSNTKTLGVFIEFDKVLDTTTKIENKFSISAVSDNFARVTREKLTKVIGVEKTTEGRSVQCAGRIDYDADRNLVIPSISKGYTSTSIKTENQELDQ